jgi:hypothetical protein
VGLQRALVVMVFGSFLVSNFRTVDPLSRAVYGTFAFGQHELLNVTSLTRECCGHGRDQLAYNLELNELHALQDLVFADIRPTSETVIAVDPNAHWYLLGQLDEKTSQRTLARTSVLGPRYVDILALAREKPAAAYYIAFPFVNNDPALRFIANWYERVATKKYARAGYELEVFLLRRR